LGLKRVSFSDLFKPKWKHSNPAVRLAAVLELPSERQATFGQVAMEDSEVEIAMAALSRVRDIKVLARLASASNHRDVRRTALSTVFEHYRGLHRSRLPELIDVVKALTDQILLAEVARTHSEHDVRKAASDRRQDVRENAILKLTNQAVLAEIAESGEDSDRASAVKSPCLTDQRLLTHIAKFDKDSGVRGLAVRRLTDQAVLAEIAGNDKDPWVRSAAVEVLADQAVLAEIAATDNDPGVSSEAASRLTDTALLVTLLGGSDKPAIRGALRGLTKLSPKIAAKEVERLCSKEHCFTEFQAGVRKCIRCGHKESCQHSFTRWEREGPDDRDRYTWLRSCIKCHEVDVTQTPPKSEW
jgi:hypothetical protein